MQKPILVDPLSLTSLHVDLKFNSISLSSASAFIVRWEKSYYVVTNWHVVTGHDADSNKCLDKIHAAVPNTMTVRFHAKGRLGGWISVDINLLDEEGEKLWLEHPLGRLVDVAAIKISPEIASQVNLFPLDLALADIDMVAMPAMPVSVIGYPLGLSAGESWPIWKTGHIASDPDIDFEIGRPAFLIDATTRSGMSGSPVVMRLESYSQADGSQILAGGVATKFMGIYAGRIHEESEIGRVWRPFVLSELFESKLLFNNITRRNSPRRLAPCPCGKQKKFKACCGQLSSS
jgi:hypothetical protein